MYQTIEELFNSITPDKIDHFIELFNQRLPLQSKLRLETADLCSDEKIDLAWDVIAERPRIIERMVMRK